MEICCKTKISAIIKENPDAIEAIAAINPHFEKLKNPILRRLLARRVTIEDAARIGKTRPEVFFERLKPLGFSVKEIPSACQHQNPTSSLEAFLEDVLTDNMQRLDVRGDIAAGKDPFQKITKALAELPEDGVLLLVNSFEPAPLINLVSSKGYSCYVEEKDEVYTYIKKENIGEETAVNPKATPAEGSFNELYTAFTGRMQTIDVRNLGMPQPMMRILETLEQLPAGQALYVHHQRVPQFLLPELKTRGFEYTLQEMDADNVKMIIYKPQSQSMAS